MLLINNFKHKLITRLCLIAISCWQPYALATETIDLIDVKTRSVAGNKAQIMLEFTGEPGEPSGFSMNDPARMIFDFNGVKNSLAQKIASQKASYGVMSGFNFVDSGDTIRLVIDVLNIVPYEIDVDKNKLIITLESDVKTKSLTVDGKYTISEIDFRRGEEGEGRLIIEFTDDSVPIDFREENSDLIVEFKGATIADTLLRKFDVKDFATNIEKVNVQRDDDNVLINISTKGQYDKIVYQLDKQFIVEVRPLNAGSASKIKTQKFKFSGEKISLNFQDIEVRSVLQLIADFTGLNMIVSDSVKGAVTLRLDNIPWDQALDYILTSKGLDKREAGNVMTIAPKEEIATREQLDLKAQQDVQSLAPLQSEFVQINYAKAGDIATTIKAKENNLLSARGQVSVDTRTNILMVQDTAENIINIKSLLERLDVPVRQVMIEAQLVNATDTLKDSLGIRFGGAATGHVGKYGVGLGPTMELARQFVNSPSSKTTLKSSTTTGTTSTTVTEGPLFFDFGAAEKNSLMGLAFSRLPGGTLLDLELQASESEKTSKTLARPKLLTLDQQTASIETGQEIPFTVQSTSASGGGAANTTTNFTTTFKKAVLKLEVTPQITPNNKISMALSLNNDSLGDEVNGQVAINTTSMKTNVLVDNGETIVLGGIFTSTESLTKQSVPYLSEIPVLGRLFNATTGSSSRNEILIFVTPTIVKSLFNK